MQAKEGRYDQRQSIFARSAKAQRVYGLEILDQKGNQRGQAADTPEPAWPIRDLRDRDANDQCGDGEKDHVGKEEAQE